MKPDVSRPGRLGRLLVREALTGAAEIASCDQSGLEPAHDRGPLWDRRGTLLDQIEARSQVGLIVLELGERRPETVVQLPDHGSEALRHLVELTHHHTGSIWH